MNRRTLLKTGAGVIAGLLKPIPAKPRERTMRVVFGFDGSDSMYTSYASFVGGFSKLHAEIQSYGHITAIKSERVVQALVARKAIVHCVKWASDYEWAKEFVPSVQITGRSDVDSLCAAIENNYLSVKAPARKSGTVHASLLSFVKRNLTPADVSIIDVSTDENVRQGNQTQCRWQRDQLESDGWTINAIVVDDKDGNKKRSMEQDVISRDGRVWDANNWGDYARALEEKMFSELVS